MSAAAIKKSPASSTIEACVRLIGEFSDDRTICAMIRTCKAWKESINSDFWRLLFNYDFPGFAEEINGRSFAIVYREAALLDRDFYVDQLDRANRNLLALRREVVDKFRSAKIKRKLIAMPISEIFAFINYYLNKIESQRKRNLELRRVINNPVYENEADRLNQEYQFFSWSVQLHRQFKNLARLQKQASNCLIRWHFGKIPPHLILQNI
ncbi:MAG TPA: hypothetical protein VLG44_01120 [Chlamydiales bacterium]|nr:hypothetical protein [Chlamydiales bacterium]